MEKNFVEYFILLWVVLFPIVLLVFAVLSYKASKKFDVKSMKEIIFREKYASGYSNKSFLTKMGGARNALEIIVGDKELWVKGIWPPFTAIGEFYDMAHKIPVSNITRKERMDKKVLVYFLNKDKKESSITLVLKDAEGFINAIHA